MITKENNTLIVKSNKLIEASYKLTAGEQKIILTLSSKIKPEDEEFKDYEFKIKDFIKLLGIKNQAKYAEVPQVTKELMRKVFTIKEEDREIQLSWLSSVTYLKGKGIVVLRFDPNLKPYLLQLKSRFTSYNLTNIIQLKSGYAFRIYELLKQYERIGQRTFDLEELKCILGIEKDRYTLYADFKRKVILKAQKEINVKTDLSFDFEQIKNGRKVTALKFIITNTTNQNNAIFQIENNNYIEQVKNIFDEDITPLEAEKIHKTANGNIYLIKEKYLLAKNQKKIKSLVPWIIKALKEDFKPPIPKEKVDSFNNYEQRKYDFDELEKKLLGWK
ncbi:replication initiation protein [Clostridium ganghwense]|uniref:Replication initiation protein n=1 Tax=Clostridium ganghwense TaxID=312089 RepID=A0ABT4CS35_9CLOT|nr:replication initiation protein [Clostridium ganghwense]MCY6371733.1 replication initiation protein [Clostridium ganghwense]